MGQTLICFIVFMFWCLILKQKTSPIREVSGPFDSPSLFSGSLRMVPPELFDQISPEQTSYLWPISLDQAPLKGWYLIQRYSLDSQPWPKVSVSSFRTNMFPFIAGQKHHIRTPLRVSIPSLILQNLGSEFLFQYDLLVVVPCGSKMEKTQHQH